MVEQLTLDSQPEVAVEQGRGTPTDQWARAVALNPQLPAIFADTARQLIAAGQRASANKVAEEIRDRHRTVGDEYQFNNNWRTPAADWLRQTHPELAVHMRTRGGRRG